MKKKLLALPSRLLPWLYIRDTYTCTPDKRTEALMRLRVLLLQADGGTLFLRRSVEVEEDFLGDSTCHTVRRISRIPGEAPTSLSFSLGTNENGETVTTDNINTQDLIMLCDTLSHED